jgi:hypothetical protein
MNLPGDEALHPEVLSQYAHMSVSELAKACELEKKPLAEDVF